MEDNHVPEIDCGTGGTSRFFASRFGCLVTGINLTPAFVSTGQSLCDWVDLTGQVKLTQGDATAMPYSVEVPDPAYMLHLAMNIASKIKLFAEV